MQKENLYKKKYDSVKKNREFRSLFKNGKNSVTDAFVCYCFMNKLAVNRLGIVASKKSVGGAVKRNRAKRVIREAFRIAEPDLRSRTDKRYDFVFIARAKTTEYKSTQVYELMRELMEKLG
ncbi:MAG: ribonuclease P protein component [Oscillospiraceae bacterium]|nr:ribonuclease P protein component [Oscillospiraceae bacterium]